VGAKEEIQVTPEMAEAGYAVVNERGPMDAICDPEWLEKAYLAMRALEPSRQAGS